VQQWHGIWLLMNQISSSPMNYHISFFLNSKVGYWVKIFNSGIEGIKSKKLDDGLILTSSNIYIDLIKMILKVSVLGNIFKVMK
jgi:hypothetical protein